ncbi:MAG: hypothetical protein MK135_12235 [Polyangiaceae bacterium]|nr:hypothetical protein [Polyangiaceae bacterium]
MEFRFIQPQLRNFDQAFSDVLVVPTWKFQRPPRDSAGLVDWRLGGTISALMRDGEVTGSLGEQILISGRPKLSFSKVLLLGSGVVDEFHLQTFVGLIDLILESVASLQLRRATIELPGRAQNLIEPARAAEVLVERGGDDPRFDSWTLIDSAGAAREMTRRLRGERRGGWKKTS